VTEDEAAHLITEKRAYYLDGSGWRIALQQDDLHYWIYQDATKEESQVLKNVQLTLGKWRESR